MKNMKLLAITVTLSLALILPACTKKGIDTTGFLQVRTKEEPQYLDPNMASGDYEYFIMINLFEGLTRANHSTLEEEPGLATHWDISEDGKTYTFHLRQGLKWSDGAPLTAHDFAFSWERLLNPAMATQYSFIMYPVKNAEAYNIGKIKDPNLLGFKAVDDHTFVVTLENPTAYFPKLLYFYPFYPLPRHVVTKYGTEWTHAAHYVGNGPFMLKEHVSHKQIVAPKNPLYWDAENVKVPGLLFKIIEDDETALKEYLAGKLDINRDPPILKLEELKNRPDLHTAPWLALLFYRFNITRPPLNDLRVRKALALSIDRQKIVETILKRGDVVQGNAVPDGFYGYESPKGLEYNPEEAKRLFAEAGFADSTKFPKMSIHTFSEAESLLVAQVVQHMWEETLGIHFDIVQEEWKTYLHTQEVLNYDISRSRWIGDYNDPNTYLEIWTGNSAVNMTGWKNAQFDLLLKQAAETLDPKMRLKLLQEAEGILLAEIPMIPIYQMVRPIMYQTYVKGMYTNLQDCHPLRTVWIDKE